MTTFTLDDLEPLVCGRCHTLIEQTRKTRDRFDWTPVRTNQGGHLHAFSRFNGRSVCGYHQEGNA